MHILQRALIGRHKVVLAPEEEFATSRGSARFKSH